MTNLKSFLLFIENKLTNKKVSQSKIIESGADLDTGISTELIPNTKGILSIEVYQPIELKHDTTGVNFRHFISDEPLKSQL